MESYLILRDASFDIPNIHPDFNPVGKHKYVNFLGLFLTICSLLISSNTKTGQNYFHIEYGLEQYSFVKCSDPSVPTTLLDSLPDKKYLVCTRHCFPDLQKVHVRSFV